MKKYGIIFVENDENQHRFGKYSVLCDGSRMAKCIESLALEGNCLPILFLRINLNVFKINDETISIKKEKRVKKLIDMIQNYQFGDFNTFQIQYMYYDCVQDKDIVKLCLHDELDYFQCLKQHCLRPII